MAAGGAPVSFSQAMACVAIGEPLAVHFLNFTQLRPQASDGTSEV